MTEPNDFNDHNGFNDQNGAAAVSANNVTSIEHRLSTHLKGEAELIPTDASLGQPASLASLRERAERRKNRRQAGLATVAAACVAVVGFGALQLGSPSDENDVAAVATSTTVPIDTTDSADDNSSAEPGETSLVSSGPGLNWERVEQGLPDGFGSFSIAATADAFYAISEPGIENPSTNRTTVYRSEDGRTWTAVAEDLDIDAYRISHSGGTFLLEGADPNGSGLNSQSFAPIYLSSTDRGVTWQPLDLPVDTEPFQATGTQIDGVPYSESPSVSVVVVGDTTVVSVSTFRFVNVPELVGADEAFNFGYEVDREGIRLYDENGQPGELVPFEEIPAFLDSGMSKQEFSDAINSELSSFSIYRSVADGPYEKTNLELSDETAFVSLLAAGDRFIAQAFGMEESTVHFQSTNGLDWEPIEFDADVYSPANNGLSLIGYGPEGPVESTDGGDTWKPVSAGDNVSIFEAARSSLGLTVVANGTQAGFPDVSPELTKDGVTVRVEFSSLDTVIVLIDEETGEILREIGSAELDEDGDAPGLVTSESGVIEITDLETGELLIQFTEEEFEAANADLDPISGPETFNIGHTVDDGQNFNWLSISDLGLSDGDFPTIFATNDVVMLQVQGRSGAQIFVADALAN